MRHYLHCPTCHSRMRRFTQDDDGDRQFYFCRRCANRMTYVASINGLGNDWPDDIFKDAVQDGVCDRDGTLLATAAAS